MNDLSLPDSLPPRWLDEIRVAVRAERSVSVLSMVLGSAVISAVIAGLIALGASYLMLRPTANADLEKSCTAEKRQAPAELRSHLLLLNTELDNIPNASQLGKNPNLWSYAKKSIDHATEEMVILNTESNDPRVDPLIAEKITGMLDELGPKMQLALKNTDGTKALAEIYEGRIAEEIRIIQSSIEKSIQATRL